MIETPWPAHDRLVLAPRGAATFNARRQTFLEAVV